ncbi:hypothetical protein COY62_00375 [bacterium (Candidatus Howlettbacteria) CG_4_10_14_0_8_um_filter_40_9]|nr:MAG: hypothetical protein COY62_00375 [bacterium (Candidatus Howlettbacteria) CG_4_10_14_0_8_um_filter_40_9]
MMTRKSRNIISLAQHYLNSKKSNQKGLTLIELLISITLLSIIIAVFTSTYVTGISVYTREVRTTNLQNESRIILDRIVSDIKQSNEVVSGSNETVLVLAAPSIDSNGSIIYENTGLFKMDFITYWLDGSALYKKVEPHLDSARPAAVTHILGDVDSVTFTYTPSASTAKEVEINIVTSIIASKKTITVNNNAKSVLRNK